MRSKTKYKIDDEGIRSLFEAAGIGNVTDIAPLGAGEFNAVFSAKAGGRDYALKIAPTPDADVMTYEKDIMTSEVFWYAKMRENTPIRVPMIYHADFERRLIESDWFIMDKLPGTQMDKMDFSKAEKETAYAELAKMTAHIHSVKNDRFGYLQNGLYGDWYTAIKAMTGAVVSDCKSKGKKTKRGEKLMRYIDENKAVLKKAECCMVNFDIWPPNILCSRENGSLSFAWIDPERSFWGDRIVDFVCLEMMKPLADKKASLAAYNAVADKPVTATADEKIRYAIAQGYLALIMETEKYFRYTPLHFGWWRNVLAAGLLYKRAFEELENG